MSCARSLALARTPTDAQPRPDYHTQPSAVLLLTEGGEALTRPTAKHTNFTDIRDDLWPVFSSAAIRTS